MRSKKSMLRFGLVLLLAGVVFLGQGWHVPHPARAAAAKVLKIMPLGDSITAGTDAGYTALLFVSYRCELQKQLTTAGYTYDFVGSVHGQWGTNIGRPLLPPPSYCTMTDFDEEGHSGWRVDDILIGASQSWPGNLQSWATSANPDIVLIHLGTVDLTSGESVDSTVTGINQVIDTLRGANPFVRILLAQILPASTGGKNGTELATIPQFNAALPALVTSKTRPGSPILLVDMHTNFIISQHTIDGVHPNQNGENKMAGRWKTAIDQIMAINVVLYSTFVPQVVN